MDKYQGWNVAVDGTSGWFCKGCGHALSWDETLTVGRTVNNCSICNTVWTPEKMGVKILEKDIRFFDNQNVYETLWFHASKKENWLEEVLNTFDVPVVHLGSYDAAIARVEDYKHSASVVGNEDVSVDWFIHEVRILPSAYIYRRIIEDVDKVFPRTVEELLNEKGADIVRYVNAWENQGSVSLIANPNVLKLFKTVKI